MFALVLQNYILGEEHISTLNWAIYVLHRYAKPSFTTKVGWMSSKISSPFPNTLLPCSVTRTAYRFNILNKTDLMISCFSSNSGLFKKS
jgi:hypothetical protein